MDRPSRSHLDDVREYYRTVGRFLDLEQAKRNDGPFWESVVREHVSPRILELGSGNGRTTIRLAPGAHRLIGIDASERSVGRARDRLSGHSHVHLVVADMRALPVSGGFDLVIAANDPFVHMSLDADRDRMLRTIAERLRHGGRFVLDAHWLSPDARLEAETPPGRIRERPLGDPDGGLIVREIWHCDRETLRCSARYEYVRGGETVGSAAFSGRLWSSTEVEERCDEAGLTVRSIWGSYDREAWDPATSPRFVVEVIRAPT